MTEPVPPPRCRTCPPRSPAPSPAWRPPSSPVRSHRSRSTGFVWRPGLVVTADEALAEEGEIAVTLPGGEAVAAVSPGATRRRTWHCCASTVRTCPRLTLAAVDPVAAGALAIGAGAQDGGPTAALGVGGRVAGGPWRSMRGGEIDARIELDLRLRAERRGRPRAGRRRPGGRHGGLRAAPARARHPGGHASSGSRRSSRAMAASRAAISASGLQPVAVEGGAGGRRW